jgi:hypothetical protein
VGSSVEQIHHAFGNFQLPEPEESEAKKKFLFYAKQIALHMLQLNPPGEAISKWLEDFAAQVQIQTADDRLQVDRMWD